MQLSVAVAVLRRALPLHKFINDAARNRLTAYDRQLMNAAGFHVHPDVTHMPVHG